ncbi:MAG: M1 family metallopeptidase [Parvularculaceae bacterium]|nr:M1 family metallopeptidase [Parvularculaceae bacterium]
MRANLFILSSLTLLAAASCGRREQTVTSAPPPAALAQAPPETAPPLPEDRRRDPFTYANYEAVRVTDLALDVSVLFEERVLDGTATLTIERLDPAAARLVLDTNDLDIRAVEAGNGEAWAPAAFILGADNPALGSKLDIELPADADQVRITYRTSPNAAALQWLTPEQTGGKKRPFMYSQNQSINARSMAPVQDTPAVRMTYSAIVRTPKDLRAVMSAENDEGPTDGNYAFRMPQPVPAYLLAIAAGDIAFKPLSATIGIYAEPSVVDAAAAEFADTPAMERVASALYGPYQWGRYDLLILPPSFPFGGMENPRLSFMTPTLIAGDKSLTGVVAHELAHSWSGNLVTNATWSDAWLNEGVTSYVENRVMEAVYGRDRAVMEQALSLEDLKAELAALENPDLTKLRLPMAIDHPDDAFTDVAYVKGQFFLHFLEERFGRAAFDAFLKAWFVEHAFKAATTDDFRTFLMERLVAAKPDAVSAADIDEWLGAPGLPATLTVPISAAFEKVDAARTEWLAGAAPAASIRVADWTAQEWLRFINGLPADISGERMKDLDLAFDLTGSRNAEIAFAWHMKAINAGYAPAMPAIETFLTRVGRGKFLYPLYLALKEKGDLATAERIFEKAKAGYHPIAQRRIEEILQAGN